MKRYQPALILSLLFMIPALTRAADAPAHAAVTAAPRSDQGWVKRNESFNQRASEGNADLIFIGDSITQGWEGAGKEAWAAHFASRKAMNLGIGGDRTEHVLWRLANGNLEGITPKAAVIMIGTNNSGANTAQEIADGNAAIVKLLRSKLPNMKILLLGVFPRSERPDATRVKLVEVNKMIAGLDDGKNVLFLDIGGKFLEADGSISKDTMPDFLHLTPKAYETWAAAIEPSLKQMLGEK